jgi:hypothetical protein
MATSLLPPGFGEPEAPVPSVPHVRDTDPRSSTGTTAKPPGEVAPGADPPDGQASPQAGRLLRYAPGMSLRELAARTRLPQDELAALDRGDTSHCGGDFYLRAHLTCIATALQVEPDVLLLAFDRRPAARVTDGTLAMRPSVRHRRHGTGKRLVWVTAIVLVLGAVGFAGYRVMNRTSSPSTTARHATTPPTKPAVRHTPRHTTLPPPVPPGTVAVSLAVAGGPTWLLAQDQNGATLFEGTVQPGAVQMLRGSAVHAVIGNAGAVTPTCNYHRGAVLGSPGQVVTMTFAPGTGGC